MTAFEIYADESGKLGKNTDYTSFCGYLAHVSEWQRFGLEWNNARVRFDVPPIHMSRIMAPERKVDEWFNKYKEWGDEWIVRRDMLLNDLSKTVRMAQVVCVGAAVDAAYFRELCSKDEAFKERFKNPVFMALHTLVMGGIRKTETVDRCNPISIFVDEDREYAVEFYQYISDLRDLFPQARRIHGVSFVNDATYPGVQAADMLAYEVRDMLVQLKKDPKTPLSERLLDLTLFGFNQPKFYTPAVLDELRAGMPREKTKEEKP